VGKSADRSVWGHFQRGLGESTRHNALAYGYSVAITATFGVLAAEGERPSVLDCFVFGVGASVAFALANATVTRGYRVEVEEEPEIVLVLGTSFGVVSVTAGVGAAALVGWALGGWVGWLVAPFAATAVYLVATAAEFVLARGVRRVTGRERLEER
jgi:hypothetical protein